MDFFKYRTCVQKCSGERETGYMLKVPPLVHFRLDLPPRRNEPKTFIEQHHIRVSRIYKKKEDEGEDRLKETAPP